MPLKIPNTGCESLKKWETDDWNNALIRHFFSAPDGGKPEPLVRLWITPEELRLASATTDCSPQEVRGLFIDAVRRAVGTRTLGLAAEKKAIRWRCADSRVPPFLSFLIFTCMVANDAAKELHSVGDFRKRLSELLGSETHGLERLRPLWQLLAVWLSIPHTPGVSHRPLKLPDIPKSGYHSIIGYSIRLSVPTRHDRDRLTRLLRDIPLIGTEADLGAVIRVFGENSRLFSSQFQTVFREFRADLANLPVSSLFHTSFWMAVRESIFERAEIEKSSAEDFRVRLELEDDDGEFWLTVTSDQELHGDDIATVRLASMRNSLFVFAVTELNGISIVGRALSPLERGRAKNKFLEPIRVAAATGVLLFEENEEGAFVMCASLPSTGQMRLLVRESLTPDLERILRSRGFQPFVSKSQYSGWTEWRDLTAEILALADFSSSRALRNIRSLQRVLPPPIIRVRGGIRAGDNFIAIAGFLPQFELAGADAFILQLQSGASISLESPKENGLWQISSSAPVEDLVGRHIVRAYINRFPIAERHLGFVETTFDSDYSGPSNSSRWIVEDALADVVAYAAITAIAESTGSSIQHQTKWDTHRAQSSQNQNWQVRDEHTKRLTTILAAIFVRQRGIAESELVSLMTSILEIEVFEVWAVFRAWVEAGILDCLIDLRWRSRFYFPRKPQPLLFKQDNQYVLVVTGLLPPFLVNRLSQVSQLNGVQVLVRRSVSEYTPSLPAYSSTSLEALRDASREAGLPVPQWLQLPEKVATSIESIIQICPIEPVNWPVFRQWDWSRRVFREKPVSPVCSTISIDWCRRDDGPDCYKIYRDGSLVWWTRSRTWALLGAFTFSGEIAFEREESGVIRSKGDTVNLPVTLARIASVLGPSNPGPVLFNGSERGYRYTFPSDKAAKSILEILWPSTSESRPELRSIIRKLADMSYRHREHLVPLPLAIIRGLRDFADPKDLQALKFVPISELPRLFSLMQLVREPRR
jgi:hypothetical protein